MRLANRRDDADIGQGLDYLLSQIGVESPAADVDEDRDEQKQNQA